jgi:hypothetical protein
MFDLPQDAYVSHLSPGRLRVKIASKKGDVIFFSSLQEQLGQLPGLEKIEVNPVTGSILLIHSLDSGSVTEFLKAQHLLKVQAGKDSFNFHQEVTRVFSAADRQVRGFIGGGINLGALAFLGLAGAGVYQIFRGNFSAIPWYSAFWYALSIFLKSKSNGNSVDDGE